MLMSAEVDKTCRFDGEMEARQLSGMSHFYGNGTEVKIIMVRQGSDQWSV